jgi:hypothetical protein
MISLFDKKTGIIFTLSLISLVLFSSLASSQSISLDITGVQDYMPNQDARINVLAKDSEGKVITGGTATMKIFYPDNSVFTERHLTELGDGLYYLAFSSPNLDGLYTVTVNFNSSKGLTVASSTFRVTTTQKPDILGNIVWVVMLFILMFVSPSLMLYQSLWKLEQKAYMFEGLTIRGKKYVVSKISKAPSRDLKSEIDHFLEFFMIEPVSLDPFGIIKKIEHIVDLSEDKFKIFVKQVAPRASPEEQADLVAALSGAMTLHQIAKIVRHFVELIRKTKNLQLAIILQMQLPMIERIAKALLKGTEAFSNGWAIGDSIGPLVGAHLIGGSRTTEFDEETLIARTKIKGKNVIIIKAKGPGARLGKLGKAVESIVKKEKINKIITIDAAAKLEGEKTGGIAEGVGVVIGGIGVDKAYIENLAVQNKIPLDGIVIKMSQEEAFMPLKKEILNSIPNVVKLVEKNVSSTKGTTLLIGVGNTCGIGNNKKDAEKAEQLIKKVLEILKRRKEEEKKKKWF